LDLHALPGALWLTRRRKLPGLLRLPGAPFYVTCHSIACAAAMPFTWTFFVHLAPAIVSALAIFRLLSTVNGAAVQARLCQITLPAGIPLPTGKNTPGGFFYTHPCRRA